MSSIPEGFSRKVYWGPSSNAGGHPMDLHAPKEPPPEATKLQTRQPPKQLVPSFMEENEDNTALDISPNVKEHLYSIFFQHIQPLYPVVTEDSLQRFPPTPLLEAVILGMAARDHCAIASWRDFCHLQKVIAYELRKLFGTRHKYQPNIQTLQALLLATMKMELTTHGHNDIMSSGLRLSLLCTMAKDLGLHQTDTILADDDKSLKDTLWKACMLSDAFFYAILGQPLSIVVWPRARANLHVRHGCFQSCFFEDTVEASHCLRSLLRAVYSCNPISETVVQACAQVVEQIRRCEQDLELRKQSYSEHEYRALRMFHHNNRLLFVLGLGPLINESGYKQDLAPILAQEASSIIPEACQTLLWFSVDFYRALACRFHLLLYCSSRALMLIVDVVLELTRMEGPLGGAVQEFDSVVTSARTLKDFLLEDTSWGTHWSQGHTLAAVLARLEGKESRSRNMPSELKTIIGLHATNQGHSSDRNPGEMLPNASDFLYDDDLLNNVLFNSTDWDSVLMQYDESYAWPTWQPGF